jgi:iron complex transport system substrate-binding protein
MRICSLLPSATEVVAGLGLVDDLVAISHECDYPPEIRDKPVVIRSLLDSSSETSPAIDIQVRAAAKAGTGLYRIDDGLLRQARPDLIITQDLCEVCAVTPTEVSRAIAGLIPTPEIVTLNPTALEDVFIDIKRMGTITNQEETADRWLTNLRHRVANVRARVASAPLRRVVCLEWLEPIYIAGHWVPELVKLAGGVDILAISGRKSAVIAWEQVVQASPDVIILMPCGFSIDQTLREMDRVTRQNGWHDLPAVRRGEVYAVDGPAFFNRPGPRLVDGAELLARLFHPDRFDSALPPGARRVT